jgi:hypothetical protein
MASHIEAAGVSIEAIDEYLRASELCLNFRKSDGGCLGYPATLLLFCVVDAIGGYLAVEKHNGVPKGETFFVLNHTSFGLNLKTIQIKRLEWWFRNGLVHNAVLPAGTCLSGEDGDAFDFAVNGDPIKIRVFPFCRLVCGAWKQFDKTLIVPSKVLEPRKTPTVGFESPESITSPVASSGCPLVPKIREM